MREDLTISEVMMWKSQCNVLGLLCLIPIWIDSSDRQQEYSPTLRSMETSGALKTNSPSLGRCLLGGLLD